MKSITINGEEKSVTAGTVNELVAELGLAPETVLVEHNGLALHRSEWPQMNVRAGDRVEILRVAAGG